MKQYFSFQWHITDECDQRCKHCYIFSENNCKKLDTMTWEQMQETFWIFARFAIGSLTSISQVETQSYTLTSGNC